MVEDGAGLLSLGLGLVGSYRARPYRRVGNLSAIVEKCWHVDTDVTRYVSEPLASMLDRYLPERAKNTLEVGLDPATVLVGCWRIVSHCQEQEKRLVAEYLSRAGRDTQEAPRPTEDAPTIDPATEREEALSFDTMEA